MKLKIFILSLLMVLASAPKVSSQERSFLSNVGISANAGTTGLGATVSVPFSKKFTARAGFGVVPYTYKYTMDELTVDLSPFDIPGFDEYTLERDINLKAKLKVPAAHFLIDYNPFKGGLGAFHITAGLYMGGSKLVHVNGRISDVDGLIDEIRDRINQEEPGLGDILDLRPSLVQVEIGDVNVRLHDDGSADAYAKVNSVRPYFGIGWGNAIPKRRVGFRFDIGAMYHGKPEITSPNADGDLMKTEDAKDFNKIISKVQFWPQLSFQLTFRLLKDK